LTSLSSPGFPTTGSGAGASFSSKGADYPTAASNYYNSYASFYSQSGGPYRSVPTISSRPEHSKLEINDRISDFGDEAPLRLFSAVQ
jgi:hypothetical protein